MLSKKILAVFLFLLLLVPMTVQAQDKTVPDAKTKPAESVKPDADTVARKGMPVIVDHAGKDAIGGMLALKLKENLHESSLFTLADKDSKAMRIKIVSCSEFADRPAVGSTYAVVWTFAENDNVLAYYISESIGLVDNSNLELEAEKLTSETDKLIDQYKFLFE